MYLGCFVVIEVCSFCCCCCCDNRTLMLLLFWYTYVFCVWLWAHLHRDDFVLLWIFMSILKLICNKSSFPQGWFAFVVDFYVDTYAVLLSYIAHLHLHRYDFTQTGQVVQKYPKIMQVRWTPVSANVLGTIRTIFKSKPYLLFGWTGSQKSSPFKRK